MQKEWLKKGTILTDGAQIGALYVAGSEWQIYRTLQGGHALAVTKGLYGKWLGRDYVEEGMLFPCPTLEGETFYTTSVPAGDLISSAEFGPFPGSTKQAFSFAQALKDSLFRGDGASLADGLYISSYGILLPTFQDKTFTGADLVLGRWLSAGMNIPVSDTDRMRKYVSWLPETDVKELLELLNLSEHSGGGGILHMPSRIDPVFSGGLEEERVRQEQSGNGGERERRARMEGEFKLAGNPELETFFRDEIIDVVDREAEYRRFGVGFPGPTLLYGPPGSGKTFAVEKLAEYLGWPVYRITTGTIGSKYIHETGKKVEEMFDLAIRNAPSVLIIDELEAFLSTRESDFGSREIHLEEVGVFLRRIPDAAKNKVLLFGMTNMYEKIDPAILRTGRFDHKIEVKLPDADQVCAVLERELKSLPTQSDLGLGKIAQELAGRPLSDVTFLVREAGKICVKQRKKTIDREVLTEAMQALGGLAPAKKIRRRIGF